MPRFGVAASQQVKIQSSASDSGLGFAEFTGFMGLQAVYKVWGSGAGLRVWD